MPATLNEAPQKHRAELVMLTRQRPLPWPLPVVATKGFLSAVYHADVSMPQAALGRCNSIHGACSFMVCNSFNAASSIRSLQLEKNAISVDSEWEFQCRKQH